MGYTRRKIHGIDLSFLLAGAIFAGWALVCAWYGFPHGLRHGSTAAFILFGLAALFFLAFPLIWARYPAKHPVNHELARFGKIREMSEKLDREMSGLVESIGPFHFTESLLIYDSGHEFQLVPYDQIASAEPAADDAPSITVKTRAGKSYRWYRTWMQGIFSPEEVLAKIRAAARLDERASADPSTASQSPSIRD